MPSVCSSAPARLGPRLISREGAAGGAELSMLGAVLPLMRTPIARMRLSL